MTEHIILGTGVSLLALHDPVELAHRIAMLDHLARGRLYWGIGSGAIASDLQLFGINAADREAVRARAAEALDVILNLWASEGKFTYHGNYFDIDAPAMDTVKDRGLYMKPYQNPHPPIGVAASSIGSGSIRLAGERGWIPMSSSLLAPPHLAGHWQMVEEGAAKAGLQPDRRQWRIARDIFVAETPKLAKERARTVMGRNYVQHQHPNRMGSILMDSTKIDLSMPDEAVDVDYLMEHIWIVGDPQQCADNIRQLYEAAGGFGTLLAITLDSDGCNRRY